MSVQTQIDRISGNVTAALAAIAEKGVTVPDGSNSDALAELIASIEAGGGSSIWGGKFTTGSFVLAKETTSTYTIATSKDEAMTGLLYDGEILSNLDVYSSIGLLVLKKSTNKFIESNYAKCLIGTVFFPIYYGSGSRTTGIVAYYNENGSIAATIGGAYANYNGLTVDFTRNQKGSPDFEYMWLAWRHLK